MRVAIISDIHNNETNLKKVLDFCAREDIKTIICCGDLASLETLDFLNANFSGTIHYAFGNMDNEQSALPSFEHITRYGHTTIYAEFGEVEIAGKKIAFVHYPDVAKLLCATGKYDFVFYGHTHKPWTEKIGSCTMLNPGNVAGDIYPPTFALWKTTSDKFELKRIHDLK
jgi:putative phosphoesterase